jgi:hypothetical protein
MMMHAVPPLGPDEHLCSDMACPWIVRPDDCVPGHCPVQGTDRTRVALAMIDANGDAVCVGTLRKGRRDA